MFSKPSQLAASPRERNQAKDMDYQEYSESEFVSKIRVERRKAQKPRIEKLRRDRINGSLNEIKNLVLEALNKDASRYSKMEKADILEMTVQFLKGAQARNTIQGGIQSRVDHAPEFHSTHCEERHVPAAAVARRNPHYPQNQLHIRMNPDILPSSSSMPLPYTSVPMVTMAAQPTIVWLPYPSPPPSPTEQIKRFPDVPDLKRAHRQSANVNDLQSISMTSPTNGVLPLWRPW